MTASPTPDAPVPDRSARHELPGGWQSHPFLEGLTGEQLAALAECAMPTSFQAGQVIFWQGEMANRFYLILEGRVILEAGLPEHSPATVDFVVGGDVLGWSWLFPPYVWNFTARALEPVQAIFFYGTWLRERCNADSALGYELMRRTVGVVIRRLQAARRQLIRLAALKG